MTNIKIVVNFLTTFAVLIALINLYLKVNKIWKRKHEKEVADSLSIVALTSEGILYLLWSTSFILSRDWNALADNAIGLVECAFYIIIGSGLFVIQKRASKKSFWQMVKDSLRLERKEAMYLLKTLSGKGQAIQIIKLLKALAWIDDDFNSKEIVLVRNFAKNWNIKLDEHDFINNINNINKSFNERFEIIKNDLKDYLAESPPKVQVKQLKDLFHKLITADGKIDKTEDLIIGELDGLILEYLGESVPLYNVIIIPQEEKHRIYIEKIIKEIDPNVDLKSIEIQIDGGFGFLVKKCYSRSYAELLANDERNIHKLMTIIKEEYS